MRNLIIHTPEIQDFRMEKLPLNYIRESEHRRENESNEGWRSGDPHPSKPSIEDACENKMPCETDPGFVGVFHALNQRLAHNYIV